MRKKSVIFIVTAVIVALMTLVFNACGKTESTSSSNTDTTTSPTTQTDVYTQLNQMLSTAGYPVTLTTKTTENNYVFRSDYSITEESGTCSVDYSYERLSTFVITDDGEIILPEDFKTTYTGNVKVRNGKIIEQDGAEVDIDVSAFDVKGITLSESALTNVQTSEGSFSAKIPSLKTVAGIDVNSSDAAIAIQYTDAKITKITITYSTASYQSEMVYKFS